MEKHFVTEITDDRLVVVRDEDSIKARPPSTDLRAENDDRRRRTGRAG